MFRAPSAVLGLALGAVLVLVLLGDAALRAGVGEMLLIAPWLLLALWAVYAFLFAPHVRTDASGIRIHNPLRTVSIPWGRVTDIGMRWQVEVRTDEPRVYKAFGGPATGRPGRPALRRDDDRAHREPPAVRDLALIQDAWESVREGAPTGPVVRRWDLPSLVSLAILVAAAVVAVLIAGPR